MWWLDKAANDLRAARLAIEADPPITDVSAFHSQQAAEKALKAFLVFHTTPFDFVHDLEYLLGLCLQADESLDGLHEPAVVLTPYAVRARYPGTHEPTVAQAQDAADRGRQVLDAIRTRLGG